MMEKALQAPCNWMEWFGLLCVFIVIFLTVWVIVKYIKQIITLFCE